MITKIVLPYGSVLGRVVQDDQNRDSLTLVCGDTIDIDNIVYEVGNDHNDGEGAPLHVAAHQNFDEAHGLRDLGIDSSVIW